MLICIDQIYTNVIALERRCFIHAEEEFIKQLQTETKRFIVTKGRKIQNRWLRL